MNRALRIGVLALMACLWTAPSHAQGGKRIQVSLVGIASPGQAVSRADLEMLNSRLRSELTRSDAFEVVDPGKEVLSISGAISLEDSTVILNLEIQSTKTLKKDIVPSRYSAFSDYLSDVQRNLPRLVSIRLAQSARGLVEAASIGKKRNKALYVVIGAVLAGGAAGVAISMQGGNASAPVVPPAPSGPGSIGVTVGVP